MTPLSLSPETEERLSTLNEEHRKDPATFMARLKTDADLRQKLGEKFADRYIEQHDRQVANEKARTDQAAKTEALFNAIFGAKAKGQTKAEAVKAASAAVERVEAVQQAEDANPFDALKEGSYDAYKPDGDVERVHAAKAGEVERVCFCIPIRP